MPLLLMAILSLPAAPPTEPARPLAVVVTMSRENIPSAALDAMANRLAKRLEASGRFLRVTSHSDILMSLGVDLRRDVLACADVACMQKVAQPLGIDQMHVGLVQRSQGALVLSLRALDVKTGKVLRTVEQPLPGESVGGWGQDIDEAGTRLLSDEPIAAASPAAPAPAPAPAPVVTTEETHSTSPLVHAGRATSVVGLAMLGAAAVVTLAGAGLGTAVFVLFTRVAGFDRQRMVMQGLFWAGLGGVGAGVVLLLLAGGLGVAGGLVAGMGA